MTIRRSLLMAALVGLLFHGAAPGAAQTTPPDVTVGAGGAQLRSADGAFIIRARGYAHFDGRFFLGDEGGGSETFVLRRVRPLLEGTLFRIYDFRFLPDFGNGSVSILEAYLDARFHPALRVRVGKYKAPVGLERLQSATAMAFVERAYPTSLLPNRDIGLQISGDLAGGLASYAVGAFNGVADGGSADVDANGETDFAARIFLQPFLATSGPLKNLGVGIAGTRGDQEGAGALASYRTSGQQVFFAFNPAGAAAPPVPGGERTRLSPQGWLYVGPVGVLGEYAIVEQEVRLGATTSPLRTTGWQGAAVIALTGETESYAGIRPASVFDPSAGSWGALELSGRVTGLSADDDAFPTFADPARSAREALAWAVGLNWLLNQNVKVVLNYERTSFTGGAPGGADRPSEQGLFTRVQLAF
jgi:phosphate-selective porin OprO and OprP